jgi:hypothetical protein
VLNVETDWIALNFASNNVNALAGAGYFENSTWVLECLGELVSVN